jgi:hypothetical protein
MDIEEENKNGAFSLPQQRDQTDSFTLVCQLLHSAFCTHKAPSI